MAERTKRPATPPAEANFNDMPNLTDGSITTPDNSDFECGDDDDYKSCSLDDKDDGDLPQLVASDDSSNGDTAKSTNGHDDEFKANLKNAFSSGKQAASKEASTKKTADNGTIGSPDFERNIRQRMNPGPAKSSGPRADGAAVNDSKTSTASACASQPNPTLTSSSRPRGEDTQAEPDGGLAKRQHPSGSETKSELANEFRAEWKDGPLSVTFFSKPTTIRASDGQPVEQRGRTTSNKLESSKKMKDNSKAMDAPGTNVDKETLAKQQNLSSILRPASEYLKMDNFFKAAERYDEAFDFVKTGGSSLLDEVSTFALSFCYVTACLGCRTLTYLEKAESHIRQMDQMETRLPSNLIHLLDYIRARFYMRWNRYGEALRHCNHACELIRDSYPCGNITYPGSSEVVPICQPKEFQAKLDDMFHECKYAPKPDAKCRGDCNQRTVDIYLTDPNFDGYYVVRCTADCEIAFHPSCYKAFTRKSPADKDNQCKPCVTPNCDGVFSTGKFINKDNEVKTFALKKPDVQNPARDVAKYSRNAKAKVEVGQTRGRQLQTAKGNTRGKSGEKLEKSKSTDRNRGVSYSEKAEAGDNNESKNSRAAVSNISVDELVEREAHPFARDGDVEDEPVKKKKPKKNKARPVVVSLPVGAIGNARRSSLSRETSLDDDSPQAFDDNEYGQGEDFAPRRGPRSPRSDKTSSQSSEVVDNFLSFLYSVVKRQPEKWISTSDENVVDALNCSVELNELLCDYVDLEGFLLAFGEPYSLIADKDRIYLVEDDDHSDFDADEENCDEFETKSRSLKTKHSPTHNSSKKSRLDQAQLEKQNAARIEKYKSEIQELRAQLEAVNNATRLYKQQQQGMVQSLSSQIAALDEEQKALSKQLVREKQKAVVDTREAKAEIDNLTSELNGLQFRLDAKVAEIGKKKEEIQVLRKLNSQLETAANIGKSCTCVKDAEFAKQRAIVAGVAILTIERENALIDAKTAYDKSRKIIDELTKPNVQKLASGPTGSYTAYIRYYEAQLNHMRHLQSAIADIGKHFNSRIAEVESGKPMASFPPVQLPELPPEPALPALLESVLSEAGNVQGGFPSSIESEDATGGQVDDQSEAATKALKALENNTTVLPPGLERRSLLMGLIPRADVEKLAADGRAHESVQHEVVEPSKPTAKVSFDKLLDAVAKKLPYLDKKQIRAGVVAFQQKNPGKMAAIGWEQSVLSICESLKELYPNKENGGFSTTQGETECMICYETLENEKLFKMDCGHEGHDKCLRPWFAQGKLCPICQA